jgi:hypothetical protein
MATFEKGNTAVRAQQGNQWIPDERVPGYLDDTFTPFLIADQNQTVHAFASQWVGEEHGKLAIVYRKWSVDKGWTLPVDILLSPSQGAQMLGAFIDSAGMIHLIFYGGLANFAKIYYSHAPVTAADQVSSWSKPEAVGERAASPVAAAISGDDQGNLTIIYNGNINGNGVYDIQSKDAGSSWSKPNPVFLTYDTDLSPYSLRLTPGQKGYLHATWNVVTSKGTDAALYYARYDIDKNQWSDPLLLEERIDIQDYFGPSYPAIVDNGQYIVIMYNSGNPYSGGPVYAGRPIQRVRLSKDEGQSWHEAVDPFPQHQGRSGEHTLVVDSNRVVHAFFIQRIESFVGSDYSMTAGIWHSMLQEGGTWSQPERYVTTVAPHDVRAVVRQGDIILMAWREDPGEGEDGIWYSYTHLDAPELPLIPLSTLPAPVSIITSTIVSPVKTLSSTPLPQFISDNQGEALIEEDNNPNLPLIIGMVSVVLVLLGFIIIRQISRIRR